MLFAQLSLLSPKKEVCCLSELVYAADMVNPEKLKKLSSKTTANSHFEHQLL